MDPRQNRLYMLGQGGDVADRSEGRASLRHHALRPSGRATRISSRRGDLASVSRITLLLLILLSYPAQLAPAGDPAEPLDFADAMRRIASLQERGELDRADALAAELLASAGDRWTPDQRRGLQYEPERSRRIRKDYPLDEQALLESLSSGIEGFTAEDFRRWESAGYFDFKVIDGRKRYFESSRSNLFFRYPEIAARRATPRDTGVERRRLAYVREVKRAHERDGQFLGAPRRHRLRMTIAVEPDVVPEGETIRCWMPYAQQFSAQAGVRLVSSSPAVEWIGREDYPMRSLYFEQPSRGAEPTVFEAEYLHTSYARYRPIDPSLADATATERWPHYDYFTREQPPHVVFDERIRRLAEEIAGGRTNPYLRARRYYDWIGRNTKYSYAREYSTLRNISRYVLDRGYGDCGQHALLFICLCRAGGVPARWQSGWTLWPERSGLHDWAEIFVEPYGWLPVDVDYAVHVVHEYPSLSADEKEEIVDFYFGGIDAHRLVINREHGYPLHPPKRFPRSDDVDFQRGELETDRGNLYFDQFDYKLETTHLDAPEVASAAAKKSREQVYFERIIAKIEPGLAGRPERLPLYLQLFQRELIGDRRLFPFHVQAEWEPDGRVLLRGFVGYEENRTALLQFLRCLGFQRVDDRIEVLPSKELGDERFGLVKVSHTLSFDRPAGPREVVTDCLLATPLFLLEEADGHFLCHGVEGYLGYVDAKDVRRVGRDELARYQAGARVHVRRDCRMSDALFLPVGARLKYVGRRGERVVAELPSGGEALLPADACEVGDGDPSPRVERVIQNARQLRGTKYRWGGNTSEGIDCSGLVQTAFAAEGINLPRDSNQQVLLGRLTATRWCRDGLRRGDTLYFLGERGKITHTAIYLGDGRYLEAVRPVVRATSFNPDDEDYHERRDAAFCFGKRLLE